MKKVNKQLTVTVGIPTCYGGQSLVETAKSLRASTGVKKFQFIVVADRTPLKPSIMKKLKALDVKVIWNTVEGSQFKKISQMQKMIKGDIFISTQDDITFPTETVAAIIREFEQDKKLTMLGARILPLYPETLFEGSMTSMVKIVDAICRFWNNGRNYLSASGRCLAFRSSHFKKFILPHTVVNGDMYMYLMNKQLKGKFIQGTDAICYIRCPQKLKDQVGPSSRYQFQKEELQQYFKIDITSEYHVPLMAMIRAYFQVFLQAPIYTLLYILVFAYTRLIRQSKSIVSNPVWKVDPSTKQVLS